MSRLEFYGWILAAQVVMMSDIPLWVTMPGSFLFGLLIALRLEKRIQRRGGEEECQTS